MPDFAEPIQQGSAHAWPFVPSAILLGALHGLEPGHSKTMMAHSRYRQRDGYPSRPSWDCRHDLAHGGRLGIAFAGMYIWRSIHGWQGLSAQADIPSEVYQVK
jgi:nickel/cobalt exporter